MRQYFASAKLELEPVVITSPLERPVKLTASGELLTLDQEHLGLFGRMIVQGWVFGGRPFPYADDPGWSYEFHTTNDWLPWSQLDSGLRCLIMSNARMYGAVIDT